ncbi:MAG TPA: hypothetical protein VFG45_00300 [Candidatus Nitrosocosmicus sp.]|nr:hypothetical protein [Candidatus Nitrosocosmicus sp.]
MERKICKYNLRILGQSRIIIATKETEFGSDSNAMHYKNSKLFLQELLSSEELLEIQFEDKEGIDFSKWDDRYSESEPGN